MSVARAALRQLPEPGSNRFSFITGVVRGLKENKPYAFLREWHDKYGPLLKVNMLVLQSVSLADPQVVKWVVRNDPARFTKGSAYNTVKRGWLDNSLVLNEDEEWRRKRKIYNQAFRLGAIRSYVPLFQDIAKSTASKWRQQYEKHELVDAVSSFESVALESIGRAGFGVDGMGKPGNSYARAFVKYLGVLQDEISSPPMLLLPQKLKRWVSHLRGQGHLSTMNAEALRVTNADSEPKREGGAEETRRNLVSLIKDAAAEEQSSLDPEQLAREANLFLFAGHDTTSASMAWVFASLAANPDIQQRAYEELAVVPECQLAEQLADPRSFPFMGAIIRETLRLYPPAPMVLRRTKFDEEIGGYSVPAGTDISMNIWCMHRDPKVFEDADTFRPDRWLIEDAQKLRCMQDHWMPFMVGARSCIGQQFSMMEMRVVIATLLRQFSVELSSSPKLEQRMLLLPKDIELRCTPR